MQTPRRLSPRPPLSSTPLRDRVLHATSPTSSSTSSNRTVTPVSLYLPSHRTSYHPYLLFCQPGLDATPSSYLSVCSVLFRIRPRLPAGFRFVRCTSFSRPFHHLVPYGLGHHLHSVYRLSPLDFSSLRTSCCSDLASTAIIVGLSSAAWLVVLVFVTVLTLEFLGSPLTEHLGFFPAYRLCGRRLGFSTDSWSSYFRF